MNLTEYYQRYLKETGSEVAAAIFALDSFHRNGQSSNDGDKLNPRDVAKQLAVSPATVITWIKTGQLKASNLASGHRPRYVIRQEDLDAFLKMRQPEPPVRRSKRNRTA